ncbi:protein of unknown function [Candidatus Filomicrobium marinum]|uniref:RlpA-like protein double-psi beta-barrel domain-containing protein n=1 Tax=Candidatus Filomicrobium marinum TaxID=1608628 RepID=A0A0D6JGU0_9HYPH|nr:septal ring lytic transglycosylase RlpA family protein [Candidatus Filomicrobium marinum]CFX49448.1 protein of unknown function [Candidatus Filomicrobium marinum]CPR20334.1 protein of unknown function [Candidatus Filomicrobium marinum]
MRTSFLADDSVCSPSRAYLIAATGLMIALAAIFAGLAVTEVEAKTPGSTYCFYKKCHRVKSLNETKALVGEDVTLAASHYNDCRFDRYNPCGLTSSGERFHPDRADNAASPIYPDGTVLLVWNEVTQDAAVIRINNAGPYWGNRKLDVSIATAEKLGFRNRGVATLKTRILQAPDKREATYRKHRRYRPVPGYIGKHENVEDAERAAVAAMAVSAIAASMIAPSSGAMAMATQAETNEEADARMERARRAKPIREALHRIEELPVRAVTIPSPPASALTDAWVQPVEPAARAAELRKDMASKTGRASAVAVEAVAQPAFGNPKDRPASVQAGLRGRIIAAHTRSSTTPVMVIRTKEVGAARSDSWKYLLYEYLKIEAKDGSWGRLSQWDEDRRSPTPQRPRYAVAVPKIARLAAFA